MRFINILCLHRNFNFHQNSKIMKKTLVLFATCVMLCTAVQAQMSVIPKVGVTFSSIVSEDDTEGQVAKTGFMAGVGVNLPVIEDLFSIQPELLYIQKGSAFEAEDFDFKFSQTLNYIEIPVLAKLAFGGDMVKFHIAAGPSVGFGLGGNYKLTAPSGKPGAYPFADSRTCQSLHRAHRGHPSSRIEPR